jgi:hypothetical protein
MSEEVKEESQPKKKGIFGKIKESVDDREEQLAILSTFVRLGILVWSGSILTLAYIKLPPALGIPEQKLDPTFIASVFTGVLATFGVQAGKKASEKSNGNGGVPTQIIRVEQAPLKITTDAPPIKSVLDGELGG